MRNWASNYEYRAARLHAPETVDEVIELVTRSAKLHALGTRHSFNHVADSVAGELISLQHLDQVVALDSDPRGPTVTVQAGITYGALCGRLHREGYALRNLASLPHISVAGACATATHGSGDRNGNLSTSVSAIEIVKADGSVAVLSRDAGGELFSGAVVSLGGLGVVTQVTLDVVPAFSVRQEVYENLPLALLKDEFEDIASSAYSVSLFTDWRGESFNQVWFKRSDASGDAVAWRPESHGLTAATNHRHPIAHLAAENCTEQMGIPGPWHERLPHFRMDFTPSSGEELQSEYLVPREHAFAALVATFELRERIAPLVQISEVRTVAADELWLSPCYRRACVAIHFTWKKDWDAVRRLLPQIEGRLEAFDARPHWGKLFTMPPGRVRSLYPKLPEFRQLLHSYDAGGKFRNRFLADYVFGLP